MVDQQDARVGLQVDQSVAAINAAEDQATGRVMRRLQANEDLDIGAVNAAKEQAEAVLEDTISRNPQLASDITPWMPLQILWHAVFRMVLQSIRRKLVLVCRVRLLHKSKQILQ